MPPPLPRCSGWVSSSLISPRRISLPRKGRRVGLHIDLFEACSAFTRVAACTLALSPIRDTLIEGFSHFVTSMTAPIASGWSESPGGTCTHWKAPPYHGAHPVRPLPAQAGLGDFGLARHLLPTLTRSKAGFVVRRGFAALAPLATPCFAGATRLSRPQRISRRIASASVGLSFCLAAHVSISARKSGSNRTPTMGVTPVAGRPRGL